MASKKTTTWDTDRPILDDFNFDMDDFDGRGKKHGATRRPITKIAANVAKGSLGHFKSEQFIRNTVAGSLPKGYDTAIEKAYEIKGSFNQLYNTAAEEYRKMRPQLAQTVRRMMPAANKMLPKPLADKLHRFSEGDTGTSRRSDPNEELLRSVLGELETTREGERLREYNEKAVKENLQEQIDSKRYSSNLRALASVDARLAQMQSFNDKMVSRYQRRSLEVMYRQYFTQRDILQLMGTEMGQQRQLLQAIMQNTALPDMDKRDLRDKLKNKLTSFAPLAISAMGGGMLTKLTENLTGRVKGGAGSFGNALSGVNMAADAAGMARGMGGDTGAEVSRGVGSFITNILMSQLMGRVGKGFNAAGFTAQKGAQAGRLAKSLPDMLSQYAGSRTKRTGYLGSAEQFVKDLMVRHTDNRRIGGAAILEAGEAGYYSKKSQKSVEEIIPGFLSKIHHELSMMRTGDHTLHPVVFNDDKDAFTTASEKTASVKSRLFDNRNMVAAQQSAKEFVDQLTAGTTLSPQAHQAILKQVLSDVLAGKPLNAAKYLRPGKEAPHLAEHRKEIMQQMRGRLKGSNGRTDQVLLAQLHSKYDVVRNTTPNVSAQIDAYRQLGAMSDLRKLGVVTEEGDHVMLNHDTFVNHMVGQQATGPVTSPVGRKDHLAAAGREKVSFRQRSQETYVNLYHPSDMNSPVILASNVSMGKYQNAKTGEPIVLMRQLVGGVLLSGRVVATAAEISKLVTGSGEPFLEFLQTSKKSVNATKGRLTRVSEALDEKLSGVGDKVDTFMEHGAGRRLRTRTGRRQAAQEAKAQVKAAAQRAPSQAVHAVQSAAASVAQAAQSVQSKVKSEAPSIYDSLITSVKRHWKKAMNVGAYAMDLFKGSKAAPVIEEAKLKAGAYVSAQSGRVIKDVRNLAEGVKDAHTGDWIATPQEVIDELRTESGEKFSDLVDKVQEGLSKVSEAAKETPLGHTVLTPEGREATFQRTASAASSATASIHEAMQPTTTPDVASTMVELVTAFKEGNLKLLDDILEVLSDRDFTQTGGNISGTPGQGGKKKHWWQKSILTGAKNSITGIGGMVKKTAGLYGNYVKTAFGLPFRAVGKVAAFAGRGFDRTHMGTEPADVFVKGEKTPRLTKGAMEAGHYFNVNPDGKRGKPIRVPKDIGGPVIDADGNTLISLEDYKKKLTDNQGHSFFGNVIRGLWSTAKVLGGFYGSLITAPIKAIGAIGKVVGEVFKLAKMPVDVYVKGDQPWEPRLTAMGMRAGIYVLKDKPSKKIRNVHDITGEVMKISGPHPEQKIFKEDFDKGLVDARGKRFPIKASMTARLVGGVLRAGGAAAGAFVHTLGAMAKLGGKVAAAPFNLLSHFLGMGPFGRKLKMPKDGLPTKDEKTHGLLNDILVTLKERLTKPTKKRTGTFQEELKEHAAEEAAQRHAIAHPHGTAATGEMDDIHHGGSGGSSGSGILNKFRKLKGYWKDLKSGKGFLGKGKKLFNMAKNLGRGGELVEGAEGAEGAVGAVEGAAGLGEAAVAGTTAAEGIATAGAVAEGGGLLAGAAGAAGSILGGIAAVISAPVVLGALAVGALAYGAYKLYSNHKLRSMKLRSLRMAQYGVDVDKDLSNSKIVGELEGLLEPHTTVSAGTATINARTMKKADLIKVTKIFGFYRSNWNPLNWFHHGTAKEANQQQALGTWMDKRFKPVFLHWIQAVHAQKEGLSISDVDDVLKPEQKRALLKQVMTIAPNIYDQMTSPFKDDPLTAGKKEVAAAQLAVLKDLGPEKGDGKGGPTSASAIANAFVASVGGLKSAIPAKAAITAAGGAAASVGALVAATKDASGKNVASKVGLTATSHLKSDFGFLGGKVSALTAVRYKTYGLSKMDPTKAKALFLLEQDVFEKIQYTSDGTASFTDDASYYFDHYQGYFGVSPTDKDAKLRWYSWFAKRFVPTILQYATAVKHANKMIDPRDAENRLGPAHLLDVATMTVAATFGSKLTTASVWSFTETPFSDNTPLNADSNSTKANIQALKDAVKKQVLQEQEAKAAAKKQTTPTGTTSAKDGISAAGATASSASTKPQLQQAVALPRGVEAGSAVAQSIAAAAGKPGAVVGQPVAQPGHGTVGDINKVPEPTGRGYAAVKATLDAAAKMTGMDPKLLGIFTGIESSWNPNAKAGTSSAKGLGQFLDSTWRAMLAKYGAKYGINPNTPQTDPRASALMLGEFIKENQRYLTKRLGRPPTDTELYIAHFLGPAGAVQLLSAPDKAIAAAVSPKAAASNASIFYRSGTALTKGQVVKLLDGKVGKFRSKVSASEPTLPTASPNTEMASTSAGVASKTTTTANGTKGGLGAETVHPKGSAAAAAAGTAALASIAPPSGGKPSAHLIMPSVAPGMPAIANDSTVDPVMVAQAAQQHKAVMADRQAQATAQAQMARTGDISTYLKQQTDLLSKAVAVLISIESNTGALPSIAKAGGLSGQSTDTASIQGAPSGASRTDDASMAGRPQPATLPRAPVSMARPQYG